LQVDYYYAWYISSTILENRMLHAYVSTKTFKVLSYIIFSVYQVMK